MTTTGQGGMLLDPTLLESWIEVRSDNTIGIRTGVSDVGTGSVETSFRQIVAEELRVPFGTVAHIVTGDTNGTPDGGIAAAVMNRSVQETLYDGFGLHPDSPFGRSALNIQKAAAYAYSALLERAAVALDAPVDLLAAAGGVISYRGREVTYAELVRGSPLDVRLEVSGTADGAGVVLLGTPPVVPVSEYRVIGTSTPNPRVPPIVNGTLLWVGDVRIPDMVHGRIVHPPTLGSTLVTVGSLLSEAFPDAEVVVVGNLVGVVSPDEWEAIRAARVLEATTAWSEWRGLPGTDGLFEALAETDWSSAPVNESSHGVAAVDDTLTEAANTLDALYALPYYKHAPINPEITVAEVRDDGVTHLWTCSQQPQALKMNLAAMLSTEPENVVVHFVEGGASFGRSNQGDGGAEAEAVLLARACGRPVRLQWSRGDDFAWSRQQAPYLGEVSVGLDAEMRLTAFSVEHRNRGVQDGRLLGALLAGLPPSAGEGLFLNRIWIEWPYDRVPAFRQRAYGARNIGEAESPIGVGLRHRSMRSPQHLQQNFAVESMMTEAAAAAGSDAIRFRIDHTTDRRLIEVLELVRELSGWAERPSPSRATASRDNGIARGRGVGVAIRHGTYLAGVAEIAVELGSGCVTVDRYWVVADVGLVVNPRLLRLNLEAGSAMGISQALHEELRFDRSRVTSTDFRSYPILTMAEMPEIEVEVIERRAAFVVGQGSEPVNMVPPVALAAAFLDATGTPLRRLPMRPEYVLAELRASSV